jgi:hypothetical protein
VTVHQADCPLNSGHWLRHAVAAAGVLAQDVPDSLADRGSAMALTDALAYFAELDTWPTVTLKDVADHANLMNQEQLAPFCTCSAL